MAFFLIGVIWDSYAVYKGLWNFTGTGLIGIKIGLLPLEEYLFFLIVPFSILTAYKVLEKKIK
jgi:lycopene cyclase domain-containing protein